MDRVVSWSNSTELLGQDCHEECEYVHVYTCKLIPCNAIEITEDNTLLLLLVFWL